MSEHYFSKRPSTERQRQIHVETIREITLEFVTDRGVFAKMGIDFGSRLFIESIQLEGKTKIADVGCGYGPIGLYVAELYPQSHVTLLNINERAIELAQENAQRNQIKRVDVLLSDRYEAVGSKKFDAILTNPPIRAGKEIVHSILKDATDHLVPGGELWVVIQKKQGAPSALRLLQSIYANVEEVTKKKGYRIYRAVHS